MNRQSSITSNSKLETKFLLNNLACALPKVTGCFNDTKLNQGNILTQQRISDSEEMFAYDAILPDVGLKVHRFDTIKTMSFRGTVMKLRSASHFLAAPENLEEGNGDRPVLKPTRKCPAKSCTSVKPRFTNANQKSSSGDDFVMKDSMAMNRAYNCNTVADDAAIQRSRNNFYKPWAISINEHATIDNNKFDNGLKNMYLGLHKSKNVASSLLSIVGSKKSNASSKSPSPSHSRLNSIEDLCKKSEKDKMLTSQIIAPTPTKMPSPFGNLLGVPNMTKSITPDEETAQKTFFWSSLFSDANSETPDANNEDQIFRPITAVSKSFNRDVSKCVSSNKNTKVAKVIKYLAVPVTEEECALDSITCSTRNSSRRLRSVKKGIKDTSVNNVIKNIGAVVKSDEVTGMKGLKTAMIDLMKGYKRESFMTPNPAPLMTPSPSPSIADMEKCNKSQKICNKSKTATPGFILTKPDVNSRFKQLRTLELNRINTVESVGNSAKKCRILKGVQLTKNAIHELKTFSPFKQIDASGKLNKYCHKMSGSMFQFDAESLAMQTPPPMRSTPKTCIVKAKQVSKARTSMFNFEQPNFSTPNPTNKNFRIQTK